MKLEPKELHGCSSPWFSESVRSGILLLIMGIGFMIVSTVSLVVFVNTFNHENMGFLVFVLVFFIIAFIFLAYGLYLFSDNKDTWILYLPYNHELFREFNKKSEKMLVENNYLFKKNSEVEMLSLLLDRKTKPPLGRSYRIIKRYSPSLVYEYALIHISGDNDIYRFEIRIENVRMTNAKFASFFQKDVQNVLEEMDYRRFRFMRER